MKCVISVLGKDRSGIVAAVSVALAECGANIDDISQTILGDMFSMTMLTTLDTEKADFNAVQEKLEGVAAELGVQITIQREDGFYSARTCLTLDMAYNNARLICRPESSWIKRG
mgnify:CR=1 FL=1